MNFDVSLLKLFRISERQTVQFRAEFFNIANHPQFLPPGNGAANPGALQISSATFGQINEAYDVFGNAAANEALKVIITPG